MRNCDLIKWPDCEWLKFAFLSCVKCAKMRYCDFVILWNGDIAIWGYSDIN